MARRAVVEDFERSPVPDRTARASAVLVLLADHGVGPEVLLLRRAETLRNHAGQMAFPGGAAEPFDADPAATALREANEEVGLDPAEVMVVASLPTLWIPVSNFAVTPVLAWWRRPSALGRFDPAEVAEVVRVPLAALADPDNRLRTAMPSGWTGPAFRVEGLLIWGFTAGVLATVLRLGGWELPWPSDRIEYLPVGGGSAVL